MNIKANNIINMITTRKSIKNLNKNFSFFDFLQFDKLGVLDN